MKKNNIDFAGEFDTYSLHFGQAAALSEYTQIRGSK